MNLLFFPLKSSTLSQFCLSHFGSSCFFFFRVLQVFSGQCCLIVKMIRCWICFCLFCLKFCLFTYLCKSASVPESMQISCYPCLFLFAYYVMHSCTWPCEFYAKVVHNLCLSKQKPNTIKRKCKLVLNATSSSGRYSVTKASKIMKLLWQMRAWARKLYTLSKITIFDILDPPVWSQSFRRRCME